MQACFALIQTDIQDGNADIFGNIEPADNLWQNPFDTWKDRPNPTIPAASELQMRDKPVAEIFMENAMAYFAGDWTGYIAEAAKESSKWRLFAK